MKILKYILTIMIVTALFISCVSEDLSIQKYYVESESNENFLMLDIPTSIISLSADASENAKQAYESIHKINFLAFKLDATNNENYLEEKEKVKAILNDKNFTTLVQFNNGGKKVVVKYLGSEDAIDEVIAFASDKEKGFALARILGDEMKPKNMLELMESLENMDKDSEIFQKMNGFFGEN